MKEILQRLNNFCRLVEENLIILRDQLDKIIAVQKKLAGDMGKDVMARQAGGALEKVKNLEKINSKLPSAIDRINKLSLEMQSEQLGVKSDAGLSSQES